VISIGDMCILCSVFCQCISVVSVLYISVIISVSATDIISE